MSAFLRNNSALGALSVAAFATVAFPSAAQESDDTIIVTAQKREQDIKDVPSSVAVIGEERLEGMLDGGADIRALAGRVPSVYVEGSSGRTAPRFYIRGLGNVDFDLSASQPVSIITDEVVLENVLFKGFPLFDIAQTEVLRGPQGSLFGRNTPAGIIKFDTNKPTEELEGYLSGSYGRFGSTKINGALSGPLGESLSARVAFQYNARNDFVENVNPGANFAGNNDGEDDLGGFQSIAARAHVLFEPNENFSSLLTAQYRDLDGTTTLFRANILSRGSNELNENYDRRTVTYDGGRNNGSELDTFGGTLKNEINFGAATLTTVTGYYSGGSNGIGDIDGGVGAGFLPTGSSPGFIPFPSETGSLDTDVEQFTQEVRLASNGDGPLNWQIGAFYFDDEFTAESAAFNGFGNPEPTIIAISTQATEAWALFGQFSYDLTNALTFTGGLRYTDEEKTLTGSRPRGFLGPIDVLTEVGDDHLSWDAALNYAVSDDVSVYARFANGFRAPSIQGRLLFSNNVTTADSETVDSYEIGMKSSFADGRVRLNASAFYYEVNDQQFTAIGGGGNFNQLINAEKGVGQGFEIDGVFNLSENFVVTAGFSYNDTEIQDPNRLVAFCGGGCTVTDPLVTVGTTTRASIDGNPFVQAPKTIFSGTARYSIPLSNGELYGLADWARTGETNLFLYESEEFNHAGNFELGLRAGYIHGEGDYEFAVFARNVTNENNLVGAIDFNNLTGFVNDPLIWGVEAKVSF